MNGSVDALLVAFRSIAMNYPVLFKLGYDIGKAVSLIFSESVNYRDDVKYLSQHPVIIDSEMKVREARRRMSTSGLSATNSEAVIIDMPTHFSRDHKKLAEKVEMGLSVSSEHQIDGEIAEAQVFFVFKSGYDNFFGSDTQTIEVHVYDQEILISNPVSVVPNPEDLPGILKMITAREEKDGSSSNRVYRALRAAVDFTYPQWAAAGRLEEYEQLVKCVERFCRQNDIAKGKAQIINRVLDLIRDFFMVNFIEGTESLIPLTKCLSKEEYDNIGRSIFVDRNHLFIPQNVFRFIIRPILNLVTYKNLIHFLVEDHYLIAGADFSGTCRMHFRIKNKICSTHMICLDGDKITIQGDQKMTLGKILQ